MKIYKGNQKRKEEPKQTTNELTKRRRSLNYRSIKLEIGETERYGGM